MPQKFQDPKDAKKKDAAGRGHLKSLTAQGRFCTKPVKLEPFPWEDEKDADT